MTTPGRLHVHSGYTFLNLYTIKIEAQVHFARNAGTLSTQSGHTQLVWVDYTYIQGTLFVKFYTITI